MYASILFVGLLVLFAYLFTLKDELSNNFYKKIYDDIELDYKMYLRFYQISHCTQSFFIRNELYVNNNEFVDQMSKSTPIIINKEEKEDYMYKVTYVYIDKNQQYDKFINDQILKLGDREFFTHKTEKVLKLFGKVYENGYILITKHLKARDDVDEYLAPFLFVIIFFLILNALGFIGFLYMISRSKKITEQEKKEYEYLKRDTQKIAFEDTLTKAATRLKFNEILKGLMEIASRFEQNYFSVIMFDIDNFKSINDTHGHDYGDHVLKTISSVVKENVRSSDTFARWGGEEFVILSPMNNLEQAVVLADKVREKIANVKYSKLESVTCSFGVVMYEGDTDEEVIMKRADKLLYKAKTNGKNRVES